MLTVSIELTHGVVRAGSSDDAVLMGEPARPEWPLSPARLFAALVAGGGTGARCPAHVSTLGLNQLELSPPDIYASSALDAVASPLAGRFVVVDERDNGSVQNYPARQAQKIAPGVRVAPRDPRLIYCWPSVDLSEAEVAALRYRAARVSYFGCSDSPAVVTVTTTAPDTQLPKWSPDPAGTVVLPIPTPGYLAALDDHFALWNSGTPARRSWLRTPLTSYRDPTSSDRIGELDAPCVWLRFARPIAGRRLVDVAELTRAAVLEHAERLVGGRDKVPEVLHGHLSGRGEDRHSVRWLPLPNAGGPHGDARLFGVCIWMPWGTPSEVIELVRAAAASVHELIRPRAYGTDVTMFDGTSRPWTSNPGRWSQRSATWTSVSPVLHEQHHKRDLSLNDVSRWCRYAGLPKPTSFFQSPVPLLPGSVVLQPNELGRSGRFRGPKSYLEVTFDAPVSGPVAIGRGRGFGLGLMAPTSGGDVD